MEKGTQKFLAIILSIALLFCFPIVSQADENIYKETFKGTYTAPETVRNVLVSGNDATVSEWYGDRVNIGGHTYSVRQNEYGLNKDGNMINMELNKSYTVWLAQYGVASFVFTASEDGLYYFTTSENSTYAPYFQSLNNIQYYNMFHPRLRLINNLNEKQYNNGYSDYGSYYRKGVDKPTSPQIVYNIKSGQTVYLTLSDVENSADVVYNVSAAKIAPENCPHNWYYNWEDRKYTKIDDEKHKYELTYTCRGCGLTKTETGEEEHSWSHQWDDDKYTSIDSEKHKCEETYKCDYCGMTKTETSEEEHGWDVIDTDYNYDNCTKTTYYRCRNCKEEKAVTEEYHDWEHTYTHMAQNCLDSSTGTRKCYTCGKTENFTYKNDGEHVPASKTVDYIGYWDIEYECVCAVCGEAYYSWEDSPCYDDESWEVHHSFGDRNSVPYGQTVTCTKCGYTYTNWKSPCYDEESGEVHHSFGDEEGIPCGQTVACTKCGETYEGEHDYKKTPITESGKCYTYTCTKCGKIDDYTRHRAWEYVQVTPQHDNVCGTYNYVCADCGALMFDEPLTCHSYASNKCGKECRRCGDEKAEHTYNDGVYIAPTCTTDGGTLYTCTECGATKLENVIPSTGHNFGNNSPTCLTCGIANPNYVAPTVPETPTTPTVPETPVTPSPTPDTTVKATALTSLTSGKKKFKAEWKKSANAQGYQLQYSTDKNFKKGTKAIIVNATSVTVSKLKENTKYYVRVRAYKTVNGEKVYTAWSKAQSVITAAPPKAAEPSKTKAGKKQFKITWKKSSDAAGYQIQYSTNKNFKKGNKSVTVKGKNTTSVTMKGLKAKKTYYVRVRSYRVVKVKGKATKIYSSWSEVKTVKIK